MSDTKDSLGRALAVAAVATIAQQVGEGVREALKRRAEERDRERAKWEKKIRDARKGKP